MHARPFKRTRYLERITMAGALAMVFMACTSSPVTTELFRKLGATEFHFGLLMGLPLIALAMQERGVPVLDWWARLEGCAARY